MGTHVTTAMPAPSKQEAVPSTAPGGLLCHWRQPAPARRRHSGTHQNSARARLLQPKGHAQCRDRNRNIPLGTCGLGHRSTRRSRGARTRAADGGARKDCVRRKPSCGDLIARYVCDVGYAHTPWAWRRLPAREAACPSVPWYPTQPTFAQARTHACTVPNARSLDPAPAFPRAHDSCSPNSTLPLPAMPLIESSARQAKDAPPPPLRAVPLPVPPRAAHHRHLRADKATGHNSIVSTQPA